MSKKQINQKRNWRIGSAIVVALFALLIGFLAWLLYVGSPKEVISVADQFKPGLGWNLTQNHVEPPRNVCIDVDCPSVSRIWENGQSLDQEKFAALIQQAGWKLTTEEDCFKLNEERPTSWCDAQGVVKGYSVSLSVTNKRDTESKSTIYLRIRKEVDVF